MKAALSAVGVFGAAASARLLHDGLLAIGLSETASTMGAIAAIVTSCGVLIVAGGRAWKHVRKAIAAVEIVIALDPRIDALEERMERVEARLSPPRNGRRFTDHEEWGKE